MSKKLLFNVYAVDTNTGDRVIVPMPERNPTLAGRKVARKFRHLRPYSARRPQWAIAVNRSLVVAGQGE